MSKSYNEVVDQIEAVILDQVQVVCPVKHHFTNGLYCREIFMPANTVITSKVHNTQHPYIISHGRVAVIREDEGFDILEAPHFGVTVPGTRRILHTLEDTVWTTCHVTDVVPVSSSEEDIQAAVDKIEAIIIEPYENKIVTNKKKEDLICHGS